MPNPLAIRHLLIRLRPLNRALRAAVERQAAVAAQLDRPDLVPYCITDEQVAVLLDRLDALPLPDSGSPALLTPAEQAAEQQVREQASAAGVALPLDELASRLGLTDDEQQALLLCAAPELDRAYERVIAYILDDLNRRFPCVELLTAVTAGSGLGGLAQRGVLGRNGRLRLLGLLTPYGEAPTELRQELRVPSGVVDFLLGSGGDLAVLAHDPGAVPVPETVAMPPQVDAAHLDRLGKALRAGDLDLVGVWGSPRAGQHEAVYALAQAAGMPLRQVTGADIEGALNVAAALGAILWLRTDDLGDASAVSGLLTRSRTPVCLSGTEPWRPPAVLAGRAYAEIAVGRPSYRDRKEMWARALPELDIDTAGDLAARYQMSDQELRAVAALARERRTPGNRRVNRPSATARCPAHVPWPGPSPRSRAARSPASPRRSSPGGGPRISSSRLRSIRWCWSSPPPAGHGPGSPRSGASPPAAAQAESRPCSPASPEPARPSPPKLSRECSVSPCSRSTCPRSSPNGSAKPRRTSRPPSGRQRKARHCLFFDEADALFGKRGEIKHGIDRYANLEVGFLLQRLEQSDGLVILASNLKENIDKAFTRRFHYIINFPRPEISERARLWRTAFPPEAVLAPDVDFSALANLDMTGAAIAGAARSAALAAAQLLCKQISMTHIVQGVSRQYQRDARILRTAELDGYGSVAVGEAHE